jgi:hypothetical protein
MTFWMRQFENTKTGQRFRVHSETQYLPPLRAEIAKLRNDPDWTDDTIYKHHAGLDIRRPGHCACGVEPLSRKRV